MFDPRLKLLARSLLEFPAALSAAEYDQILAALLSHLGIPSAGNIRLLAAPDRDRHLLKYMARHYLDRSGDFLVEERQLYPKMEETIIYLLELGTNSLSPLEIKPLIAHILNRLGVGHDQVLDSLLQALEYPNIRLAAADALGKLGKKDQRVVDTLLHTLGDEDSYVRRAAAVALGQLAAKDQRVVDALLQTLGDENSHFRREAAIALGQLGVKDQRGVDALLQTLGDQDILVRRAAVDALGQLGVKDQRVVDALVQLVFQEYQRVVDVLLGTTLDNYYSEYSKARQSAVEALGQLGVKDQWVVEALLHTMGDQDKWVRQKAAAALGQLGFTEPRVEDALLHTLGDQDTWVRRAAAVALLRLSFLLQQALGDLEMRVTSKLLPRLSIRPSAPPGSGIVRYLIETAASGDLQPVFDTPHAVRMIIQAFLDESSGDSIYYSLLFFSITQLRLALAGELLPLLSDPDTDERTKQVIFQLLLRVELLEG
jgi:HEAT repeat protein